MTYFVYILRSKKDNRYYTGMSKNVIKRLEYHNKGLVKSTKHRIPFEIVYIETFDSKVKAREREKYLKSYKGSKDKLTILNKL